MPFRKIHSEKLAEAVVRQIELLILRGVLRPSERLPAERELSERLGVSRPILRTAIADLSERGLLTSRAGSGIFIAEELRSTYSAPLVSLFSRHAEAISDTIDFRMDIEALAAERAARFATDSDRALINRLFEKMEAAHKLGNAEVEAQLDADFHMAIIESAHNVIMLHMMRTMFQLMRDGVFYNRQIIFGQQTTREALLDQHRAINTAVQSREPEKARAAAQTHLGFVKSALLQEQKIQKNEAIAKLKLEQEEAR